MTKVRLVRESKVTTFPISGTSRFIIMYEDVIKGIKCYVTKTFIRESAQTKWSYFYFATNQETGDMVEQGTSPGLLTTAETLLLKNQYEAEDNAIVEKIK